MTIAVTAIVPTLARSERFECLQRAIASLRASVGEPERLHIVVVINGHVADDRVVAWLDEQALEVLRISEGSAPLAQLAGRRAVRSPYFCFLDDDDEYLLGAIDQRLAALSAAPTAGLVVTNGWRNVNGQDQLAFESLARAASDPLRALFSENWMASCSGLFRSEVVGASHFETPPHYLEWTWLAWRISRANLDILFLDAPSFRIHDSPASESKSRAYDDAHVDLYKRMLADTPPSDIARMIRRRMQNFWAVRSLALWTQGDLPAAKHAMSEVFALPSPWRYFTLALRVLLRRPHSSTWRSAP